LQGVQFIYKTFSDKSLLIKDLEAISPFCFTLEVTLHLAPEYIQLQDQIITDDCKRTPERLIYRLRVTTFWLSLALGAVLLLALVGGVVGSILGFRHSSVDGSPSPAGALL
jgi:hypothetical protein